MTTGCLLHLWDTCLTELLERWAFLHGSLQSIRAIRGRVAKSVGLEHSSAVTGEAEGDNSSNKGLSALHDVIDQRILGCCQELFQVPAFHFNQVNRFLL